MESEVTIEATDKGTAERQALEAVKKKPFELSEAQEQVEVADVLPD